MVIEVIENSHLMFKDIQMVHPPPNICGRLTDKTSLGWDGLGFILKLGSSIIQLLIII